MVRNGAYIYASLWNATRHKTYIHRDTHGRYAKTGVYGGALTTDHTDDHFATRKLCLVILHLQIISRYTIERWTGENALKANHPGIHFAIDDRVCDSFSMPWWERARAGCENIGPWSRRSRHVVFEAIDDVTLEK